MASPREYHYCGLQLGFIVGPDENLVNLTPHLVCMEDLGLIPLDLPRRVPSLTLCRIWDREVDAYDPRPLAPGDRDGSQK